MSWFGGNENGGRNVYNKPRPAELGHVHRPVIIDHNGVKHPIVGLDYERNNAKQFAARTEKVVKYRRFQGTADEEYIPSRTEEYGTYDLSGKKDDYSTEFHDEGARGPIKDSPWDNRFRLNSPPSRDHRHATHDDDEHHNIRVNNTKGTWPKNMKNQEYYEHENPKTNGYSPPKYPVPISSHHDHRGKGNDNAIRARMGPFETSPRNETSYETANFQPVAYSPPRLNPQPKKEHGNYNQETIDSTEARKRYGKGVAGFGPGLNNAEDKHSGRTIDSREAAKRYNGVLMTN